MTILLLTFIILNISGYLVLAVIEGRSMEPLLRYGDLVLVISVPPNEIKVNDIVVYKSCRYGNLIIHRVVDIVRKNGRYYFVTKGDNNLMPDSSLPGNEFREGFPCTQIRAPGVPYERIVGKVITISKFPIKIPYVGMITILFKNIFKI